MAVFPGTYIPTGVASTAAFNHLIDVLMTPRIMAFRQIHIYDEPAELAPNKITWGVTWGNWLTAAPLVIRKNGVVLSSGATNIDYIYGTFQANPVDLGLDSKPRDIVEVNYIFDYFTTPVLEGFYTAAMSIVNMTGVGPPTSYTVDNMPTAWEGVVTDVAFAMCCEKLLLDFDLWKYRLVFTVGPGDVNGGEGSGSGSGDIANQLSTLKTNAENRANSAMENPKFKTGNYLAPPTMFYYQSIRGFGSMTQHGMMFIGGRLNGWKPNKFL
jgi:hypothetical protein